MTAGIRPLRAATVPLCMGKKTRLPWVYFDHGSSFRQSTQPCCCHCGPRSNQEHFASTQQIEQPLTRTNRTEYSTLSASEDQARLGLADRFIAIQNFFLLAAKV